LKNGFTAAQKSFFKTFDLPLTNRFSGVMLSLRNEQNGELRLLISLSNRIGLFSDNHGHLKALQQAIDVLRRRGAEQLIHLGDFCDSLHRRNLAAIVRVLKENAILSVKGNNDFIVEKRLGLTPDRGSGDREGIYGYLKDIPLKIVSGDLCFAHSLPFDSIRSFYEPVDDGSILKAAEIFRQTSHRLLFCGHSHLPVLFHFSLNQVSREPLPENQPLVLNPSERYIIVVGALELGECALFHRQEQVYESIKIF
jgi:hypothetical protein